MTYLWTNEPHPSANDDAAVEARLEPAFDDDDAQFMMEEEAAEIALRSKARYARSPRRVEPRRGAR